MTEIDSLSFLPNVHVGGVAALAGAGTGGRYGSLVKALHTSVGVECWISE